MKIEPPKIAKFFLKTVPVKVIVFGFYIKIEPPKNAWFSSKMLLLSIYWVSWDERKSTPPAN